MGSGKPPVPVGARIGTWLVWASLALTGVFAFPDAAVIVAMSQGSFWDGSAASRTWAGSMAGAVLLFSLWCLSALAYAARARRWARIVALGLFSPVFAAYAWGFSIR